MKSTTSPFTPIPYRSLADPEIQGERSIDPLGLATLADHLANWILSGLTARMWRPRFLTAIAATSVTVEPFGEQLAKDRATSPCSFASGSWDP